MFRDVQVFHPHLPDSVFVGDGASDCLDEIQNGDEDPSTRLQRLTERIEAEFPPEEILLVCPRGWTICLTEHALCELRRWSRWAGRFRTGTKRELEARQAKRQARMKKVWKICLSIYLCMYASMHACMYGSMDLWIYASMFLCIYGCMFLCYYVSMHLCISVSMYLCLYVPMYLWIYGSIYLSI